MNKKDPFGLIIHKRTSQSLVKEARTFYYVQLKTVFCLKSFWESNKLYILKLGVFSFKLQNVYQ